MCPTKTNNSHAHRDDLAGEHPFGDAGQLIIAIIFLVVWITDSFFFRYSTFLNKYIPLAVQITIGLILLLVSIIMARTGMKIVFGEFREKPEVIRKGIFGIVRHPVYLSEILFYLSLLIFRTSLAALAIWIIAIGFFHYISRYEEKLLLQRFGDEYRKYMEDVPMFLPKIKIKRNK